MGGGVIRHENPMVFAKYFRIVFDNFLYLSLQEIFGSVHLEIGFRPVDAYFFLLVMFQFYNHNNFFLRIQYRQQHLPSPRINNISTMNILDDLDDELDELETTTKPKVKILNKRKNINL